jgi:hypothetical protein
VAKLRDFLTTLTKIAFMKKLRAGVPRECLLLFSPESLVFQFAVQKYKDLKYGTMILPVVLFGSLSHFVNRLLRTILGLKGMR